MTASPVDDLAFAVRSVLDDANLLKHCRSVEHDFDFENGEVCVMTTHSALRKGSAAFQGTGLIVIDRGWGTKVWVKRA